MNKRILDGIDAPGFLEKLSLTELEELAEEIRGEILGTVSENGGHLAPNLGVVELTIALHRVFHTPQDKIVWDVGHQSYPHKLLTGRSEQFHTIRLHNGLCGFTKSDESPHDCFGAGHAGTSISAAMGFAAARDLRKSDENVIAVIGDGALICGIALEAMNNVRSSCKNLIIVVNDNKMSISRSIGAIPNYLNRIITGRNYNRFKAFAKMSISRLHAGEEIVNNIKKLESSTKSLFVPGVFFEEMGIRYLGPINGHQLPELIQTFEHAKEYKRPVLIHVITEKGHGCEYAKDAPEKFHGVSAFDPDTGKMTPHLHGLRDTFSTVFGRTLEALAEKDNRIIAITAAMASGTGLMNFSNRFPERFFDVGIAEEHALVFAAGLAADGMRPVVAMYATFLQRALDCVFHDICLQNLPVVICADRAGIVEDGPTHHGIYDLSFLLSMPNLSVMAPANELELPEMLSLATSRNSPCVIRYPRGNSDMPSCDSLHTPIEWGKAEIVRDGTDLAIWTYGRELYNALKIAEILKESGNLNCRVVNARFLKPFDSAQLREDALRMPLATIEDNLISGGLRTLAAEYLLDVKHHGVMSFGWPLEQIVPHGSPDKLRHDFFMQPDQIAEVLLKRFGK